MSITVTIHQIPHPTYSQQVTDDDEHGDRGVGLQVHGDEQHALDERSDTVHGELFALVQHQLQTADRDGDQLGLFGRRARDQLQQDAVELGVEIFQIDAQGVT